MISADNLFPAGALLDDENESNYFKGRLVDNGCSASPSCLECPLAYCVYEDKAMVRKAQLGAHDATRAKFYWDTVATDGAKAAMLKVCEVYEITERTVHRLLKRVWSED